MRKILVVITLLFLVSCSGSNQDEKVCTDYLKSNLNDASSFEMVEFFPVDSTWNTGTHEKPVINKEGAGELFHIEYRMKYRANNAMGAKVLAAHQFFVDQQNHTVISDGKLE